MDDEPAVTEDETARPAAAESRGERPHRRARHARLYGSALLLVVAIVVIVALIVANTRQVRISWVVGDSTASLVWIVVVAALVGWVAGLATGLVFRQRTRSRRPD